MSNDLTLPAPEALPELFRQPEKIDRLIGDIEAKARAHEPDLTTVKGRKAIASLAYDIARSKTALDDAGKRLNEGLRTQINVVDAERRKVRDRFDALKDEVRAPLTAWEKAEEDRVEAHKERIAEMEALAVDVISVAAIKRSLEALNSFTIDARFEEFETQAHRTKSTILAELTWKLEGEERREAERQELERLRAEAAARAEEEQRRLAAEKAERRRAEVERERQEAIAKAEKDAEERASRKAAEDAAKALAVQQKRDRETAEREAELKRQVAEAEAREQRAAQAERDRIAAEQKAADDARAKREADRAHRMRIRNQVVDAIKMVGGLQNKPAENIADALMAGKIPHCEVKL